MRGNATFRKRGDQDYATTQHTAHWIEENNNIILLGQQNVFVMFLYIFQLPLSALSTSIFSGAMPEMKKKMFKNLAIFNVFT